MDTNDKQRILAVLDRRFPNNRIAPEHFYRLIEEYAQSDSRPPHLVAEIETADEQKLWSYIWEAILYRHLRSLRYIPKNLTRASGQHGPDFAIQHGDKTIWIEAVVPSPEGVPAEWLELPRQNEIKARSMPDTERVLRCTSAICDKQKKFTEYQAKSIISPNDCTVIAVNICRLSDLDIDGNGISRCPLSMEALFGIGPIAVPILEDRTLGVAQNIPRYAIRKPSGKEVETVNFFSSTFANVSAVLQAHQRDLHQKPLILATIHNPLATNPLPRGIFHAHKEFVAKQEGEYFQIQNIAIDPK